jgi:hypothetical protein
MFFIAMRAVAHRQNVGCEIEQQNIFILFADFAYSSFAQHDTKGTTVVKDNCFPLKRSRPLHAFKMLAQEISIGADEKSTTTF